MSTVCSVRPPARGLVTVLCALIALPLMSCSASPSQGASSTTAPPSVSQTAATYGLTAAFKPSTAAQNGSTDVYHCSLIDPHLTSDRILVASQFFPGAPKEVHHAIYFLIPPDKAARARSLNVGGRGWSCFGSPLNPAGTFDASVWLGGWAPGPAVVHATPAGTGIPMPAGSLVVMQIHYNLLAGAEPDRSRVRLTTVPAAGSSLKELLITKYVAPPDLPCPSGLTGPLCDRQASVEDLIARTGQQAQTLLTAIEWACRADHDPNRPQMNGTLVTTTCTWPVDQVMHILGATPHMHLLGRSESIELLSGSQVTTLVNVGNYNFDNQVSYAAEPAVTAHPGDSIRVTCTYDPTLRQELPQLRKLPARYVTWGDGSSDEMCLGAVGWTKA